MNYWRVLERMLRVCVHIANTAERKTLTAYWWAGDRAIEWDIAQARADIRAGRVVPLEQVLEGVEESKGE
jgi:hypothetical protein